MMEGSDNWMASMAGLYAKIHKVMSDFQYVEKRGHNDFHNYDYVMAADVIAAARELMSKHGLVLLAHAENVEYVALQNPQGKTDLRARVRMTYRLCDIESGAFLERNFEAEGQDAGDKAIYKAYTGCLKYFLVNTFQIPTGDDPEDDGKQQKPQQAQPRQPQAQPRQAQPQPQQSQSGGGTCRDCGAPQVLSQSSGKWYCSKKCWNNKKPGGA
jgi:hypothetical protein